MKRDGVVKMLRRMKSVVKRAKVAGRKKKVLEGREARGLWRSIEGCAICFG